MRIVRCKDNAVRADDAGGVCQTILIWLARDKTTLASDVVAGLFWNAVGMMHRTRVMIVHAPHPIGEPGGADFQKDEFDARIFLHDAAADQRHDADQYIERHT